MVIRLKVRDAMNPNPKFVSADTTVENALKFMLKRKIGSLLVLKKNKMIGILTEKDLLEKVLAKHKNPKKLKVKEIMTTELISVLPDDPLGNAAKIMVKENIRRLPVVENKKIAGMLTVKDLLQIEPSLIEILHERLKMRDPSFDIRRAITIPGYCDSCGEYIESLKQVNGDFLCPNCS